MATMVCSTLLLLCSVLIVQSSAFSDEPKQRDGCTGLSCESGLIERLVRLVIENKHLKERLALVEKEKLKDVSVKYRLSGEKSVTDGQRLMFDLPVFDNGNAYDAEKGEFVAPVTGLYLVVTNVCVARPNWIEVGVMKDGTLVDQFVTGDNAFGTCNSESTLTKLVQGDRVWPQKVGGPATTLVEYHGRNSFSVALIRAY